jgi:hypothetical protein
MTILGGLNCIMLRSETPPLVEAVQGQYVIPDFDAQPRFLRSEFEVCLKLAGRELHFLASLKCGRVTFDVRLSEECS